MIIIEDIAYNWDMQESNEEKGTFTVVVSLLLWGLLLAVAPAVAARNGGFAQGAGVELLSVGVASSDPQYGDYTDNAVVGGVLHELLGGPPVSLVKFPLLGRTRPLSGTPHLRRVFDVLGNRLARHKENSSGAGVHIEVEKGAAAHPLSLP